MTPSMTPVQVQFSRARKAALAARRALVALGDSAVHFSEEEHADLRDMHDDLAKAREVVASLRKAAIAHHTDG